MPLDPQVQAVLDKTRTVEVAVPTRLDARLAPSFGAAPRQPFFGHDQHPHETSEPSKVFTIR
jgi:hypothetical protein